MAKINVNYNKIPPAYGFLEIAKRVELFRKENPETKVIRLGIGDTTQPLTPTVIKGLLAGVKKLADIKTYTGYGEYKGELNLRQALSDFYKKRGIKIDEEEIFISDGAKPDSANISSIFASDSVVAVSNPVYPVYADSNIIAGKKVVYMECKKENGFAAPLPKGKVDLIFLCSPNNPTGAVMTRKQLEEFVKYAKKNKAVIIFDAAYAEYITDKNLPRSIYEVAGAKSCAIEINSFSKWAGFTGVRLGWAVVPMDLAVEDAEKGKVNSLWNRRQTTMFNGASNIVQEGGLAVFSSEGQKECQRLVNYYMDNAKVIKNGLEKMGLEVYGGENAPYIWLKVPQGMSSWDFFDKLLKETGVVGTPGSIFGPAGEGYFRFSAYGHKEETEKAVKSMQENLII